MPGAEPISCLLLHDGEQYILKISIRGQRGWVEVRGQLDVDDNDLFQKVIDSLPDFFVSSLMSSVDPVVVVPWDRYKIAYDLLLRLLNAKGEEVIL